jgi:glucose-6-phosphate isomerase
MTSNLEFCLVFLLNSLLLSATVTEAWSPGSLLRFGRGPRLRPVPTNLCVLAGRPRKSSSVQLPEDFDNDGKVTRQQRELRSMLEQQQQQENGFYADVKSTSLGTASPSFSNDVYNKKVDLASVAPQYFTPDPLETNDISDGSGAGNSYNHFLTVPQLNLPTRIAQPGLGLQHHHRAVKSLVHERFGRQPNQNNGVEDPKSRLVSKKPEWKRLENHKAEIEQSHLRDLLQDEERAQGMFAEHDGVYLDYSRQRATSRTMDLLQDLAKTQGLEERIQDMVTGKKINFTEKRAVLHTALRAAPSEEIFVDGVNVVEEIHDVLDQIKYFTEGVRNGDILGYTGKRLRNVISVGIGGSYLGPEFLHEVLKTEPEGINSALGYNLRFLANVDPIDVERTCADLDPEETLIIVVSKTFTTAETMLNARAMRQWLWDFMGNDKDVVRKHIVACSSISSIDKVEEFGIDTENYFFRFWDWVGGRYSVCSAVGAVPISLMYGFDLFEQFLKGAQSVDEHFKTAPMDKNIPVIMGLLGVWNHSFLNYKTRTTLPYAEALLRLPSHIQQLDMESNGKVMTKHGVEVDYNVGEIDFGEPGTNGQHSFFQLLHMGQTAPCDFIGFCQSQHDLCLDNESLSSHDELMANFFAQPDALANGKTEDEVRAEGIEEELIPHRVFKGNRPSMSLLMPKLTAYAAGQLLAIYEHRTAVQGFIWDINSFDQWGVELGKQLADDVKSKLIEARKNVDKGNHVIEASNPASSRILNYYVDNSSSNTCFTGDTMFNDANKLDANPMTRITRKTHQDHSRAFSSVAPPTQHDLGGNKGRL